MMDNLVCFENLNGYDEIRHCYTTRHGGVSNGVFMSLNMGFGRGDDVHNVMENYQRVADTLGLDLEGFVLSDQVHRDNIREVTGKDAGKGIVRKRDYDSVDGLVTDVRGITLVTFYADCVPLFFYDPSNHAIGMGHAGWRGTVLDIGGKTVRKMTDVFGSKPSELVVGIGPSIGVCCYEVDESVKKSLNYYSIVI